MFYDCGWKEIGTKRSLEPLVSSITGISRERLYNYREASVAQNMFWAAKRETARLEDRPYSLLGLFNVNMPTLYGEGIKAFRRLHLEILGSTEDESLFIWTEDRHFHAAGLLADSPSNFSDSGDIVRRTVQNRPPFSMTNKGLRIELALIPVTQERGGGTYGDFWAPLNCARESIQGSVSLVLFPESLDGKHCTSNDNSTAFRRTSYLANIKGREKYEESTLLYVKEKEGGWCSGIRSNRGISAFAGYRPEPELLVKRAPICLWNTAFM